MFVQIFIIGLLLFCLLLALYAFVKLTVKLVRWVARKFAALVRLTIRVIRYPIAKGLVLVRKAIYYLKWAINYAVAACNQGFAYIDQRVRRRGYPTYHTPTPYDTSQEKALDPTYYSFSDPIDRPTSTTVSTPVMEDTYFKPTINRGPIKQVEPVRFCQICGAPLDLSCSSSDIPVICRECGSELSLGIDPICRKPVILGEDAVHCSHCLTVFHRRHVAVWASSHGRCPFCNSLLTHEIIEIT